MPQFAIDAYRDKTCIEIVGYLERNADMALRKLQLTFAVSGLGKRSGTH